MAVIRILSDLRTNERATPPVLNKGSRDGFIKKFNVPAANFSDGDAGSVVELFTLHAYELLITNLFWFSHSAWEAGGTIDIGYAGDIDSSGNLTVITEADGSTTTADQDGIATAIDGDAVATMVSLAATAVVEQISFTVDVIIFATSVGAAVLTSDTCSGVAIVSPHEM